MVFYLFISMIGLCVAAWVKQSYSSLRVLFIQAFKFIGSFVYDAFALSLMPSLRSLSKLFQLSALRSFLVRLSWRVDDPVNLAV